MVETNKNEPIDLDSLYAEVKRKLEALDLRVEALEEAKYHEQQK